MIKGKHVSSLGPDRLVHARSAVAASGLGCRTYPGLSAAADPNNPETVVLTICPYCGNLNWTLFKLPQYGYIVNIVRASAA